MKSLAWKLAIVAAVMGVGVLVMLQAQHAMNRAVSNKSAHSADDSNATVDSSAKPDHVPLPDLDRIANEPPLDAGKRPANEAKPAPEVADTKGDPKPGKTADASKPADSPKMVASTAPDKRTATPVSKVPPTSDDPFADGPDSKHRPAAEPPKTAAATPIPELKQTGATADEGPAKSEPASEPRSQPSAPGGPALPTAPPAGQPELNEPKTSPKQQDPVGAPQGEPRAEPNDVGGPALLAPEPGKGPAVPPALSTAAASPRAAAAPRPNAGPAPAGQAEIDKPHADAPNPHSADGPTGSNAARQGPSGSDAGKNGHEPDAFPALDDPPAAPKTPQNKSASKNGGSAAPGPLERPTPLPADRGLEAPLPGSSVPRRPASPGTGQPARPEQGAEAHSEPGADFRGDGTMGESAPLGMQRPQLNIEKVAPPNALLGQPMVYSIVVKNVGSSEARDVVIEDRIPKGTKLSGTIPRAELAGKKLSWRIGNLASGEQRKIAVRVVPLEAGEIGSIATVNFVAEAAAGTVVTAPRLQLDIAAKQNARLGEIVPFRFRVKNIGTGEARGVVIRDLIPQGLLHTAGNDLEYEVGRLPPGQSKELTLDLKAVKVGSAVNRAVAVAEGGLSVEAKAGLEVSGSKVSLTRNGPTRRFLGRPGVYTNTLVNESPFAVDGVVIVESVPAGMEFAGASHGGQYNDGTRTIAWRLDRMAQGETCVVKSKLVPKAAGNHTSTVRVTAPNGEPTETSGETVVEGFVALGIDVPGVEGPLDVGEKVTYRINVRNKGTIPATNVLVTVEIPEQLALQSARGPGKHAQDGNVVRFGPVPSMEGRTEATCELVLEARKRGDSRIKITAQADQIEKPLAREESILILAEPADSSVSK